MNPLKKISIVFVLIASFSFQSCDNEPIDSAIVIPETSSNGVFKVNFDGQEFVSNSVTATKITLPGSTNATYQISGLLTGTITKGVLLSFTENSTGTFLTGGVPYTQGGGGTISYLENVALPTTVFTSVNYSSPMSSTGQINVTSNDTTAKLISGTFNCTVYLFDPVTSTVTSTKVLSNGIFTNILYTE